MQPRMYPKGAHYLCTRCVIDRTYMLDLSDDRVNALFRYTFAVYAAKHNVTLHALCVVVNHLHFTCTDNNGVLGDFLRDVFRTLAAGMNMVLNRTGTFWAPEEPTHRTRIDHGDYTTLAWKTAYVIINGYKHGYVAKYQSWPGLVTALDQLGDPEEWIRPTKVHFSERRDSTMPASAELIFYAPKGIASAAWVEMVKAAIRALRSEHKHKYVRRLPVWRKPMPLTRDEKARYRRFRGCRLLRMFAGPPERRKRMIGEYLGFVSRHAAARASWVPGKKQTVLFPAGTGAMRRLALVEEEPVECLPVPAFIDEYMGSEYDDPDRWVEHGVVLKEPKSRTRRRR